MKTCFKLDTYKQHMAARGVASTTAFPPAWHMLWSAGIRLPPPPFLGFLPLLVITGGIFGPLFGFGIWALQNRGLRETAAGQALWVALIAGASFGVVMALYYRNLARKHRLGKWAAFTRAETGS